MAFLLHQLLEESARRCPDRAAVACEGRSLTWAALDRCADALAATLVGYGLRRGERVGMLIEPSIEAVVGIFAVLKAGAVFVPMDPAGPPARVVFQLSECEIRHLITRPGQIEMPRTVRESYGGLTCVVGLEAETVQADRAPASDAPFAVVPWERVLGRAGAPPSLEELPTVPGAGRGDALDLAGILYPWADGGAPRGVMHTHRSLLAFVRWAASTFEPGERDRLAFPAPLSVDLGLLGVFLAAATGVSLMIPAPQEYADPEKLAVWMEGERISIWGSSPATLLQLLERGGLRRFRLEPLRTVIFAGEPFPIRPLRELQRHLQRARFIRLYGPLETLAVTFHPVPRLKSTDAGPVPIGRACAGVEMRVADERGGELPAGTIGELYVRGPAVMAGYWRRPDLSAAALVRLEVDPRAEAFCRTGDLVQRLPDGSWRLVGRRERLVRVRGHRVELDAVEAALGRLDEVVEAAVYLGAPEDGEAVIEAAVSLRPGVMMTGRALLARLGNALPAWMTPGRVVFRDRLPRLPSGEIDRQALEIFPS